PAERPPQQMAELPEVPSVEGVLGVIDGVAPEQGRRGRRGQDVGHGDGTEGAQRFHGQPPCCERSSYSPRLAGGKRSPPASRGLYDSGSGPHSLPTRPVDGKPTFPRRAPLDTSSSVLCNRETPRTEPSCADTFAPFSLSWLSYRRPQPRTRNPPRS